DTATCLGQLSARLDDLAEADDLPAAIIVEAVQGVSGVVEPPHDFLIGIRNLATQHGILLILDEIWNGFGRAGQWFSFERSGVCPDLAAFGKGLSGGLPLAGVAASSSIFNAWPPGMHTSTFQGNPMACTMAVATIDTIRDEDLIKHVQTVVEVVFRYRFADLSHHHSVLAVRTIGAQTGIEFINENGDPDEAIVIDIQRRCLEKGVLVYAGGRHSNVLMLLPPILIDRAVLEAGLDVVLDIAMRCLNV
ncbi:MAG: aminotransferase class III-fold pyridoxal phosphate-dependent enzyme, partial [Pseudomonadota bacterium]